MTFNPDCAHDKGFYLCDTPNDPHFWMFWCCVERCGYCTPVHPVTMMSFPRKKPAEAKLQPLKYKDVG